MCVCNSMTKNEMKSELQAEFSLPLFCSHERNQTTSKNKCATSQRMFEPVYPLHSTNLSMLHATV